MWISIQNYPEFDTNLKDGELEFIFNADIISLSE